MSEQLDVYTYAVMRGAHFHVGSIGREWIARCIVPGCSSQHDAFSVQPEGKHTGRWAGYGAWMCRKCWDPSENDERTGRKKGWGTIADLVMLCESIPYREAERFILEYEGQTIPLAQRPALTQASRKTDAQWFAESSVYLEASQRAGQAERKMVLDYLALRGLTVETARRLGFGYSLDKVRMEDGTYREIPFLVIPWYKDRAAGTLYRKIGRRNLHTPLPGDESKYYVRAQSDHDMLYLGETLREQKRPTFLLESESCAATVLQEAGDLVHAVATGSTEHGRTALNEMLLRRQPYVFLAFDTDQKGEDAANYWHEKLGSTKSRRYRPLAHDVNDMHTSGFSVREWIEQALTLVPGQTEEKHMETNEQLVVRNCEPTPTFQSDTVSPAGQEEQTVIRVAKCLSQEGLAFFTVIEHQVFIYTPVPLSERVMRLLHTHEATLLQWLAPELPAVNPLHVVDVLGEPEQVTTTKHDPGITLEQYARCYVRPPYRPVTFPALPRKQCPHQVIREEQGHIRLEKAGCKGQVLAHGWCELHAPSYELLCLGAFLGYPAVQLGGRGILAGVAGWEAYAECFSPEHLRADITKIRVKFNYHEPFPEQAGSC